MKSNLLVFARYQQSSPKQLYGLPLVSVRLSRARGSVSSTSTPVNSVAQPLGGLNSLAVRLNSLDDIAHYIIKCYVRKIGISHLSAQDNFNLLILPKI